MTERKIQESIKLIKLKMVNVCEDDSLFDLIAFANKKLFDSLVNESFTEEQAMHIVTQQGFTITLP